MKKKCLILSIIMLLMVNLTVINVYAVSISSSQVTMTTSKVEYNPGDIVEFTVSLKNLKLGKGIIAFGAVIDYDSNLLELNKVAEGCGYWNTAKIGSDFCRFGTTRNEDQNGNVYSQGDEDIVKIKFTVKDVTTKTTLKVGLSDIEMSNGELYRLSKINSNNITILPKTTTPDNPGGDIDNPGDNDNPGGDIDNPGDNDNPGGDIDNPGDNDNPGGDTDNPGDNDNPGGDIDNPGDNDNPGGDIDNPGDNNNPNPGGDIDNPGDNDNPGGDIDNPENNDNPGENNDNPGSNNNVGNNNNKPTNNNNSGENSSNKPNTSYSKLPNLGNNSSLVILIGIASVIAIILFTRMRILDRKIKKQANDILEVTNKKR